MRYQAFRKKNVLWGALCLALVLSNYAIAMTVQPMVKEIGPNGRDSQYSIQIDNSSSNTLTIELIPRHIKMSKDGQEKWSSADNDLLVIPATAIIRPGKSQRVMVQYIGDPQIRQSQAYRISVKQVPIDLSGSGKQAINIGVNFNTLLNVVPVTAKAKLQVRSLKRAGKIWLVELENSGDRFVRVSKTQWSFTDKSGTQRKLSGKTIAQSLNGNLVLPHSIRVFEMRPQGSFSPESIKNNNIEAGS